MAREQRKLRRATESALAAIAREVEQGLAETVGVQCEFALAERAAVRLLLCPEKLGKYTPAEIAQAIDAENVEAWCDGENRILVGINPWHTAKDTDQTVLAVIKVTHVLLGMHATADDVMRAQSFGNRFKLKLHEILVLLQPPQNPQK